jgi:exopolysaccharide biosynthesis polyprenyl glycosylphosphotransferase
MRDVKIRTLKLINAILVTVPFAICWMLYYGSRIISPYYRRGDMLVIALFLLLYVTFGRIYQAFQISYFRVSEIIYSQILSAFFADIIMYIIIWLLSKHLPNFLPLLEGLGVQCLVSVLWSLYANHWYFKSFMPVKTAIIYDQRDGMEELINEYGMNKKYDVQTTVTSEKCLADINCLEGVNTVFLAGVHSHDRNIILKYCIEKDINVLLIPRIGDTIMSAAAPFHMFHLPMLRLSRYMATPEYLFIKRFMDIILSGLALIILSPILLITAIAVKSDGGPVFYKQTRLTKDGKTFEMIKFRSMRVDAEKDGIARLSTGDKDDRITPVGKFIRKVRIDELPQLWLILTGKMSIVGPRPERPEIAIQYEKELPEFSLRLQAKAGLTGYAQVYGKYNTTPYDKLQMDLMYIAHPGIVADCKIIFATIKILFLPESTEGISEGSTTALQDSNKSENND